MSNHKPSVGCLQCCLSVVVSVGFNFVLACWCALGREWHWKVIMLSCLNFFPSYVGKPGVAEEYNIVKRREIWRMERSPFYSSLCTQQDWGHRIREIIISVINIYIVSFRLQQTTLQGPYLSSAKAFAKVGVKFQYSKPFLPIMTRFQIQRMRGYKVGLSKTSVLGSISPKKSRVKQN